MATLDDLPNVDVSTLSDEDLNNYLRQLRGRRILPDKKTREATAKKSVKRAKPVAATDFKQLLSGLSKEEAAKLFKTLGGGSNE